MRCFVACIFAFLFYSNAISEADVSTASWLEERLFLRARCKAKCLKLFESKPEQALFLSTWKQFELRQTSFDQCFDDDSDQCSSSCFMACDQPLDQCRFSCSGNKGIGCQIGCTLLDSSIDPRPGDCPADETTAVRSSHVNSPGTKCSRLCQSDNDCAESLHKCCTIGCSNFCTQPVFNDSVPVLAHTLKPIVSKDSTALVDLDWSVPYAQTEKTNGPIVIILQTRICVCKHFDSSHLTDWQTLIMTHQFGAKLDAFEPGKMYQFRIAAVSPFGSRGFGPSSEPYPSNPQPPDPPSPPRNLTDLMWRFHSTGTINVLVSWISPNHSDLPVVEYSVRWMIDHGYLQPGGQSLEGLTQFTQTISAAKTQYVIQNLMPSTSYKVQIRAISYWHGHGPLESQPNTIFLSTKTVIPVFATSTNSKHHIFNTLTMHNDLQSSNTTGCECGSHSSNSRAMILQKMFYDNEELVATFTFKQPIPGIAYLLEWAPQVCINPREDDLVHTRQTLRVQGRTRMVFLNNLHFSCRYTVRVRPYSHEPSTAHPQRKSLKELPENRLADELPTVYDCFCTPSCADVEVNRGPSPVNCTLPDPEPPPAPLGLQVRKLENLTYRLSWKAPIPSHRDSRANPNDRVVPTLEITKYRIVWAPRVEEPVSKEMYNDDIGFTPIMDLQKSDARILNRNQTWIDLHNLKEDTFYIARVQAIGASKHDQERESLPTSVYFVTPKVNRLPLNSDTRTGKRLKSKGSNVIHSDTIQLALVNIFFYVITHKRYW